jgi:hypothetical protein
MLTFQDLSEKLAEQHDEVSLCELLKVTPQDLVDAFADRIEANFSYLVDQVE